MKTVDQIPTPLPDIYDTMIDNNEVWFVNEEGNGFLIWDFARFSVC